MQQYFDQGLIYKGYKIQPYCPRCETPLSSHEVSLGYKDVKDPSVYIKLKVKGEENTYFLVWTTTPWTLISNVAIAVHPEIDYVKVEHKDQKIILAEARLSVLGDEYTVLEKFKGAALAGKEYDRMYSFILLKKKDGMSFLRILSRRKTVPVSCIWRRRTAKTIIKSEENINCRRFIP